MARIRTIKPDFFKNEQLSELPAITRLLFIGLWTQADKEGRMLDRPKRLKAEIFPYDNVNMETELSRLQSAGFIIRYEVGELKVIQVDKFTRHQRISGTEALTKSELPAPPKAAHKREEAEGSTEENFGSTKEALRIAGREGKGKEGNGDDGKETRSPPPAQFGNVTSKSISDLMEDCLKDRVYFVEHLCRQTGLTPEDVPKRMRDFNEHLASLGESVKTVKDYRQHAQNWIKKKLKEQTPTNAPNVKIKVK